MVMITPALNALTDKYPNAQITILTSPDGRRVLKNFHPQIKDIWILNRKTLLPFIQNRKIKRDIRQADFQHIFCFETKASFAELFNESAAHHHILRNIKNSELNFAQRCLNLIDSSYSKNKYPVYLPVDDAAKQRARNKKSLWT